MGGRREKIWLHAGILHPLLIVTQRPRGRGRRLGIPGTPILGFIFIIPPDTWGQAVSRTKSGSFHSSKILTSIFTPCSFPHTSHTRSLISRSSRTTSGRTPLRGAFALPS